MTTASRARLCARSATAAAIAVCAIAWPAAAQDEWDDEYYSPGPAPADPYDRNGVYVGAGALFALENFDRDNAVRGTGTGQKVGGEDAGGPEVRFGYRYDPRIAGEVLFQYYAGFEVSSKDKVTLVKTDDDFSGWSLTLNGKLYGLLGRVQPYALLGMGGIVFDDKKGANSGFLARLGAGIDFYVTESVVVDFEAAYALPGGSIDDLQFATFGLGIQYRY